ncbi:unnamed protein product [Ilex paraguariensis]|uniref:Uncharacterized protein n=1 Tax=Ilex paraguariensis TaxID=185542 RepID=A0ABC8TUG3_9AQUA
MDKASLMDRLNQASDLVDTIRVGPNRLARALSFASQTHQSNESVRLITNEAASMQHYLQNSELLVGITFPSCKRSGTSSMNNGQSKLLRQLEKLQATGRIFLLAQGLGRKELEDSGVLNESLRSRSNSWGLHMPLVCPDGAVVAYAWKRQLAGQAGASAVDRTRCVPKL